MSLPIIPITDNPCFNYFFSIIAWFAFFMLVPFWAIRLVNRS